MNTAHVMFFVILLVEFKVRYDYGQSFIRIYIYINIYKYHDHLSVMALIMASIHTGFSETRVPLNPIDSSSRAHLEMETYMVCSCCFLINQ